MFDRNTFQGIAIKFHYVRRPSDKYSITITKILFHFIDRKFRLSKYVLLG